MKTFHCDNCKQLVFFENVRCESCAARLGFVPGSNAIIAFEPSDDGFWVSLNGTTPGEKYKPCINYELQNVCNWMIASESPDTLCFACGLTRTIPNLDQLDNRRYWYRLEVAKRRLLYSLWALGLTVESKYSNAETGLEFEFLENLPTGERVMTGHDNGLITMNVAEADDAYREQLKAQMHEPYRTLLGHFRHEIGHYYFDRLVKDTSWEEPFRAMFGDERTDYGQALDAHYQNGAPENWEMSYVSAYASTHPWEDWAETWAHYLHIVDTVDTAAACGLKLKPTGDNAPTLTDSTPIENKSFDDLMKRWFPLTYALNSLNRSLGLADAYPFALSAQVVEKLGFVHRVIATSGKQMTDA